MRTILLDSVDSTNEYLKRISRKETEVFLFVRALEQTSGKGRLGRTWVSEKNSTLILSCLLPYHEKGFQMGLVAAASAISVIKDLAHFDAQIKWPNDVYLSGKKMGGILAEKNGENLIVGIGLNLNQNSFEEDLRQKAVSLFQVTGKIVSLEEFSLHFQRRFFFDYQFWLSSPTGFIKDRVAPFLAWKNKKILVEYNFGESEEGIIRGIDESGFLVLETKMGEKKITAGDLKLWLQE